MLSKEELKFPVEWHYKIITDGSEETLDTIKKVLKELLISATPQKSNVSKNGTYTSYTLSIIFNAKVEMEKVSNALEKVKGIKFLL